MKPPPTFDRAFLRELAGRAVLKAGEQLFQSRAVESAEWESPVLVGQVRSAEAAYNPRLNLRSTVFTENQCACPDGRKRRVCAHAVAVALHYEALAQKRHNASEVNGPPPPLEKAPAQEPASTGPRSIRVDPASKPLRLLAFLPPNLEESAERNAIVLKLDVAVGRAILPAGQLSPAEAYAVAPAHEKAICLIESWCGGRLAALLQLTRSRLRRLLATLEGEPAVYWVKQPNEPIAWQGDRLPGVHEFLDLTDEEADEGAPALVAPAVVEPATPRSPRPGLVTRVRKPARANLRALAESRGKKLFQSKPGDYETAKLAADSMESYSNNRAVVDGSPNYLVIRLPAHDDSIRPLRELLKSAGFMLEPSNRKWWLRDRHRTLNFLAERWRELRDKWRAEFTANFKERFKSVDFSSLHAQAKEESGGAFSLQVSLSGQADELALRKAMASGKSYVDNREGPITLLDQSSLQRLHEIERAVSGQVDRPLTPTFSKRLGTAELADVEEVLDEYCGGWQPPQAWQSRSRALKQIDALEPAPIRPGFDEILRGYQRIGVAWLWHLYRHEMGGILADEMGLGKTLQALALVECIRSTNASAEPALVVCPASLVENWMREAAHFTPGLRLLKQHGPKRPKEPVMLEDADLVITSYGALRQDAELMSTMDWSVVIGDEAQHIKNRRSQNARTLTRLQSHGRFLLTGTPVENSLDDLLSLFTFLMPGYLDKRPQKLTQEERAWHNRRQTQRAAAYILRRVKKEVAADLPDKIEKTFFCELGSQQRRFYRDVLEKTRQKLFKLEDSGANESRLKFAALTELLRLRQACVDPRILDQNFPADQSAKLAAFDETLDECLDNGSRMLVFSSFVTALKLLAERLKTRGHRFAYLDGSTKNRLAICDEFNADADIPVFLISLKAGGVGLNLTGADTVLHYDPWWNPAAEAQATDRAHRIGQDKVVTSIKLIAANTLEEKILGLQARKAALLQELFDASEVANAKVSIDEIKELLA